MSSTPSSGSLLPPLPYGRIDADENYILTLLHKAQREPLTFREVRYLEACIADCGEHGQHSLVRDVSTPRDGGQAIPRPAGTAVPFTPAGTPASPQSARIRTPETTDYLFSRNDEEELAFFLEPSFRPGGPS